MTTQQTLYSSDNLVSFESIYIGTQASIATCRFHITPVQAESLLAFPVFNTIQNHLLLSFTELTSSGKIDAEKSHNAVYDLKTAQNSQKTRQDKGRPLYK